MTHPLTGTGIWSSALRYGDPAEAAAAGAELEELGYRALWVPDVGGDVFGAVANLLGGDDHGDGRHRASSTCGCTRRRRRPLVMPPSRPSTAGGSSSGSASATAR